MNLDAVTSIDWAGAFEEACTILSSYIRINTSNPPGNELDGALFIKSLFDGEGIDSAIYTAAEKRGNLAAFLRGKGTEKPLVLLNHIDTVPVETDERWDVPPFSGTIRDGYLWGRGTLDMKGMAVLEMMAMLLLKRSKAALSRDVIFIASADEEKGGREGIEYIYDRIPELSGACCVLNEGGGIRLSGSSDAPVYCIGVAEKVSIRMKITVRGSGGHGSLYTADNPNLMLLRVLQKLDDLACEEPHSLIETTDTFFKRLAPLQHGGAAEKYANLDYWLNDREFAAQFRQNSYYDAMVRNTIVITMLQSGSKINVVPAAASAYIDCRLIPGVSIKSFYDRIAGRLRDEKITVEVVEQGIESPPSAAENPLFRAIERFAERHDPGAVVTPFMMTGGSDSSFLRSRGIDTYGFVPFRLSAGEKQRVHGRNERLSLDNLKFGIRAMMELVAELG